MEAADNDRCVSFGAEPGTNAYADCRVKLFQMRVNVAQAEEEQASRAVQDRYDQQMQSYRAPLPQMTAPAAPTHCITNSYGQTIYTNCN